MAKLTRRKNKRQTANTSRQRLRNQKGGAAENAKAWLDLATAIATDDSTFKTDQYTMKAFEIDRLRLPNVSDEDGDKFILGFKAEENKDLRVEAMILSLILGSVISETVNPTADQFKKYIVTNVTNGEVDMQADNKITIDYLLRIENALRSTSGKADKFPAVTRLDDETKYPLLIWMLVKAKPEQVPEIEPTFVPADTKEAKPVEQAG